MRRWALLTCGLACAAAACCPCDEAPAELPESTSVDGDAHVEFGSMEPGGPPPDAWASEPPSWGAKLPASDQAARMLSEASPHASGNVEHALLLCDVSIKNPGQYDTLALPDPSATLTLGERAPLTLRGGEEEWRMVFTVPGVRVVEGEAWRLLMVDRDVTSDDRIGESVATYTGSSPLDMSQEHFRATCHVFPREEVEPYAVEALKQADRALSAPALKGAPVLGASELGYPKRPFNQAAEGIGGAAALLTWHDQRVQERVQRWEELEARWRANAHAAVQADLEQTTPGGWRAVPGWEGLMARVTEVHLPHTPPRSGYVVTLELKNTGALELVLKPGQLFPPDEGFFARFVFDGGDIGEAKLAVRLGGAAFYLKPGEQVERVFEQADRHTHDHPGALFGVQLGKQERGVLLRLPAGAP